VEVVVAGLTILNEARTPPFPIADESPVSEDVRLKYRYLDLRRPRCSRTSCCAIRLTSAIRRYFDANGFLEIETPILTKSTPEGARDYLVPSRVPPGEFFALPQSPQIFKQILMIAGMDRYVQICRCFRDEDLRADRQPEFTQVDVEMSFARPETIFDLIEPLMRDIFAVVGRTIETPFLRLLVCGGDGDVRVRTSRTCAAGCRSRICASSSASRASACSARSSARAAPSVGSWCRRPAPTRAARWTASSTRRRRWGGGLVWARAPTTAP
jgi:hypothetical protein